MSACARTALPRRLRTRAFAIAVITACACLAAPSGAADRLDRIHRLMEKAAGAELALSRAQAAFDNAPDAATERTLQACMTDVESTRAALDDARVAVIAEFMELEPQAIASRRAAGDSWIKITNDLGVHPSIIGIQLIDDRPPSLGAPAGP